MLNLVDKTLRFYVRRNIESVKVFVFFFVTENLHMTRKNSDAPKTASIDQDAEADKLLSVLDQTQMEFFSLFTDRHPELLTAHSWNVCTKFWRERHRKDTEPFEKTTVLEWRKPPGGRALLGENKAREHLDLLVKEGFVDQFLLPGSRLIYVRATPKLLDGLRKLLLTGANAAKENFGKS